MDSSEVLTSFLVHIWLCVHFRFALDWCGEEFDICAIGCIEPLREQIGGVQSSKPLENFH